VLGDWHLKRLAHQRYDPFAPRLAASDTLASWRLALAAWRGRF